MYYRNKSHWGTHMWNYIHTITIIDFVDNNDNLYHSKIAYEILKNLKFNCKSCQTEYDNELLNININKLNIPMYLFEWGWNLHNKINIKLNKPIITYDKALKIHTTII
jgi:hypothetical protein